jgi:hypothetical protein
VISVFSALLEVCLVSEEPVCFSLKDVAIFGVLVLELELLLLYTKVVEFRGDVDRGEGHRDGNSCGVLQPTGDEDVGDPRIHSTDSSTLKIKIYNLNLKNPKSSWLSGSILIWC